MTRRLALYASYILIIGLFTFLPAVNAAPGILDPTFSLDGIATSPFGGNAIDRGYALALQQDGKILVAGNALYGARMYFTVTRFNPDSTLDTSFSSDGKAYFTSNNTVYTSTCRGLALQPDGKIVAACDLSLFRLNADGSPDTSFNDSGSVMTPLYSLTAVGVQPDGRILAAGSKNNGTDTDFAIAGFNPDGSLDMTFDADGLVTTDFSIGANDAVNSITIQPDGQIVAAEIESMTRHARQIAAGEVGTLRIGHPASITFSVLPEMLSVLSEKHPLLNVQMMELPAEDFDTALLNYHIDIGINREPAKVKGVASKQILTENFALVVPENHPLAKKTKVDLSEAKDEWFVLPFLAGKSEHVSQLQAMFEEAGFVPRVRFESDLGATLLGLVAKGLGVSLMPFSYSYHLPTGVRFIKIPAVTTLFAVWRRGDENAVLQNFLKVIENFTSQ